MPHDPYHPTLILAPHDDGTWRQSRLLSQHRVDGVWRVTVSYRVADFTFWRALPASECRPLAERADP